MNLLLLLAALGGAGMYIGSKKSTGRNARGFFQWGSAGCFLLFLTIIPGPFLLPGPLDLINTVVKLVPSAICFLIAANSIIKEMRAQQRGEHTEAV